MSLPGGRRWGRHGRNSGASRRQLLLCPPQGADRRAGPPTSPGGRGILVLLFSERPLSSCQLRQTPTSDLWQAPRSDLWKMPSGWWKWHDLPRRSSAPGGAHAVRSLSLLPPCRARGLRCALQAGLLPRLSSQRCCRLPRGAAPMGLTLPATSQLWAGARAGHRSGSSSCCARLQVTWAGWSRDLWSGGRLRQLLVRRGSPRRGCPALAAVLLREALAAQARRGGAHCIH